MPRFRRWHLAPAAILLFAGLHGAAWLAAGWHLRAALDDLARPEPRQPWRIAYGDVRPGGWPFAATLDVDDLRFENAANRTSIRIAGARVAIALRHPTLTGITITGPVVIETDGQRTAEINALRAEASLTLAAPHEITLAVRGLNTTTGAGPIALDRLDIRAIPRPAASTAETALALDASAEGIELGGLALVLRGPLGTRIAGIALNATLSGPIDLRLPGPAHIARAWRNAGGVLTIAALDVQWSRLDLNLQATIGLDAALQPDGRGTAGAGGIPETLDRAVGEGLMPAASARAVKAVIGLMPQTPDRKISLPLTLQNQTLTAARFPLIRMPELQWP
ncbi:MAG: DUF2125 domain-containing protein [Alphaproteobacteria bacterium]|nr:DUF2125 domain-containing protein [Alphaproteobacteria bacterium]